MNQGSTTSVSGARPLDVEERIRVVEQVSKKIDALHLTNGKHEVTLRLHPDHLGEVRLTIVADRNQVTARFLAETAQARQAMTEGREQLRAALEQKGFTLSSLDVNPLSNREAEAAKAAQATGMNSSQGLDLSMNFGGERRPGGALNNQGSAGGRAVVRTPAGDQAEALSAVSAAGASPRRRSNGRLDYSA